MKEYRITDEATLNEVASYIREKYAEGFCVNSGEDFLYWSKIGDDRLNKNDYTYECSTEILKDIITTSPNAHDYEYYRVIKEIDLEKSVEIDPEYVENLEYENANMAMYLGNECGLSEEQISDICSSGCR